MTPYSYFIPFFMYIISLFLQEWQLCFRKFAVSQNRIRMCYFGVRWKRWACRSRTKIWSKVDGSLGTDWETWSEQWDQTLERECGSPIWHQYSDGLQEGDTDFGKGGGGCSNQRETNALQKLNYPLSLFSQKYWEIQCATTTFSERI